MAASIELYVLSFLVHTFLLRGTIGPIKSSLGGGGTPLLDILTR